jgi:hypothetical protein
MSDYLSRVLADSEDRPAWQAARAHVIGASDAAALSKPESLDRYLLAKLKSGTWQGNAYTVDGNAMEPAMLAWAGVPRNTLLIHSVDEPGFAATPDGIQVLPSGEIVLAEVKRTNKPFKTIPLRYLRQVWWAQYVVGATRTKFIWAEHGGDFELTNIDPHIKIIDRDDEQIASMLAIATPLLARLRAALAYEQELAA